MDKRKLGNFILDLLFPKHCLSCQTEGPYLCPDCLSLLEIMENSYCLCQNPQRLPQPGKCPRCRKKSLNGLFFALAYKNNLTRKLIHQLKYEPYIKELAKTLALLIITHFDLIQKRLVGENYILLPVPLYKKRLKQRGYNQSEEIAKVLSENLHIPLILNCLLKIKESRAQMELSRQEREENIKGVFEVKNNQLIFGRKILLVDDVYTTGSTMEECAKILKEAGAREVWGIAAAREE